MQQTTLDPQKVLSKTFCPLPFMHAYITGNGSVVSCCEAQEDKMISSEEKFDQGWSGERYRKLREQLLNGERPETCKKCWANEDAGMMSNRQEMLSDWGKGFFGTSEIAFDATHAVAHSPTFIELKCNNICNLKCRMCHPESSYRIAEDKEIIDKYRKGLPWAKKPISSKERVDDLLSADSDPLSKVKIVQFSGGEPLISHEQYHLIKYLLDHKKPEDICLRYATNLTQLRFEDFDYPEIWRRFKNVNVKVSLDGLYDVYDYIRVGASFEKVLANLDYLLSLKLPNVGFSIGFTTQAYNVFQVADFVTFFERYINRSAITTHLLHSPKILSVDVLPPQVRRKIAADIRSKRDDLEGICGVLENAPQNPEKWKQFLNYTAEMENKYAVKPGFLNLLDKYVGQ